MSASALLTASAALLPALTRLYLQNNGIGEAGASALGAALGRGALPRLQELDLNANRIGSAGVIALAPGLRALPQLKTLWLNNNAMDDDGVGCCQAHRRDPDQN